MPNAKDRAKEYERIRLSQTVSWIGVSGKRTEAHTFHPHYQHNTLCMRPIPRYTVGLHIQEGEPTCLQCQGHKAKREAADG